MVGQTPFSARVPSLYHSQCEYWTEGFDQPEVKSHVTSPLRRLTKLLTRLPAFSSPHFTSKTSSPSSNPSELVLESKTEHSIKSQKSPKTSETIQASFEKTKIWKVEGSEKCDVMRTLLRAVRSICWIIISFDSLTCPQTSRKVSLHVLQWRRIK